MVSRLDMKATQTIPKTSSCSSYLKIIQKEKFSAQGIFFKLINQVVWKYQLEYHKLQSQ